MKRIGREPPRRLLRRSEMTRLMSMIFMMVVLAMLIQSARNPDLWRTWVGQNNQQKVGDEEPLPAEEGRQTKADGEKKAEAGKQAKVASAPIAAPTKPAPQAASHPANPNDDTSPISNGLQPGSAGNLPKPVAPQPEAGKSRSAAANPTPEGQAATSKKPAAIPAATGRTDEDPDEKAEAVEDFDAIDDTKVSVRVLNEESQAYERLVRWVTNQPYAYMLARAKYKNPTYGEFIEAPAEHRKIGKLYQFDLDLRRLTPFPDPFTFDHSEDEDPHQPVRLYEAWGSMQQAGGRLFSLVVCDPPQGMPLGNSLRVNVHFVGYFFKLLAYEPAKNRPGDKLHIAPILIGRIEWLRPPPPALIGRNDLTWAIILGGGIVLVILFWIVRTLLDQNPRCLAPLATERSLPPSVTIDQWLDRAEAGNEKADDDPETAPIVIDDKDAPHSSNGHAKEGGRMRAEE